MGNSELHLFLHGLIILLVGLIGGLPFAKAIMKKENEVAWRVVHSGSSMGGIMLIAIGGLVNKLSISVLFISVLSWGIIIATYVFVVGMVVAALTKKRGLDSSQKNTIPRLIYLLYGVGTFLSLISIIGFIFSTFVSIYF